MYDIGSTRSMLAAAKARGRQQHAYLQQMVRLGSLLARLEWRKHNSTNEIRVSCLLCCYVPTS
jgi:hypothetical protein